MNVHSHSREVNSVGKVTAEHIEARRTDIRDAAFRLFVRKGVEGARMEEIAAEAGLSAGAIYRYYDSKEDLLRAVLSYCADQRSGFFDMEGLAGAAPLDVLTAKARAVWQMLGTIEGRDLTILGLESALAGARYANGVAAERREMWEGIIGFVESFLSAAAARDEFDADVDHHALAQTLVAIWIGFEVLSLDLGPAVERERTYAAVIDIIRRFTPASTRQEDNY
jgi:TetR/AcrR family transcriptional regulator, transcriptional repressor of aconitase